MRVVKCCVGWCVCVCVCMFVCVCARNANEYHHQGVELQTILNLAENCSQMKGHVYVLKGAFMLKLCVKVSVKQKKKNNKIEVKHKSFQSKKKKKIRGRPLEENCWKRRIKKKKTKTRIRLPFFSHYLLNTWRGKKERTRNNSNE